MYVPGRARMRVVFATYILSLRDPTTEIVLYIFYNARVYRAACRRGTRTHLSLRFPSYSCVRSRWVSIYFFEVRNERAPLGAVGSVSGYLSFGRTSCRIHGRAGRYLCTHESAEPAERQCVNSSMYIREWLYESGHTPKNSKWPDPAGPCVVAISMRDTLDAGLYYVFNSRGSHTCKVTGTGAHRGNGRSSTCGRLDGHSSLTDVPNSVSISRPLSVQFLFFNFFILFFTFFIFIFLLFLFLFFLFGKLFVLFFGHISWSGGR